MAAFRKKQGRHEPLFDATPTPGMGLRLSADDRVGGPPEKKRAKGAASEPEMIAPRAERRSRSPKADNDDARGSARGAKGRGAKKKRGGAGGGGGRIKRLAYWVAVLCLWVGVAAGGVLIWVFAHLPPIQSLEVPPRPPSVQIVGLGGATLATRGEMGGAAVPLKELPAYLPKAFMAIEDRRFYSHFGIDPIGVARAMVSNVTRRRMREGASTLTQQLAKNLFLTQDRTLQRKTQEFVLALWLERKFSKDQILDLYLNRVYFGAGAYGVEAASQRYFGKSARQVTMAEAALLAGLVQSPSRLAPTRNPEGAAKRAQVVVAAMQDAGFIDEKMAKTVSANPAKIAKAAGNGSAGYVADWVMDVLDDLIGRFDQDIVVETTVDPAMQAAAEKAINEELTAKGAKFDVEQGALVAITPQGAVRALVGGKSYAESQFNRAVAARRQPGSAFKAFVFLTALEKAGLTPESIREDRPINIKGWAPENYTRDYAGPVTLQRALANSLNTVSVRLTMEVGPKAVAQTAHRLGISSKLEPNASIALGTSEVSVLEMTSAFVPFANGGIMMTPHVVTRIKGANGKVLYRRDQASLGRIIDARYVGMMNQMMAETVATGTARKADLPGWRAAGKTGTSQEFRDAWFIGYTGQLVTGVWLGNDDSSATKKASGGTLPVEIWSRFMKVAHQNMQPAELPGIGQRYAPQPPMAGYPQGQPLPPPGAPSVIGTPAAVPAAYPPGGHPSAVQPRYPIQQAQPPRPVPPGSVPSGGGPRPPGGIPGATGSVPQGAQYRPPANTARSEERSFIDKLFGSR